MKKITLIIFLSFIFQNAIGQTDKEFSKSLTIFTTDKFDKRFNIIFEPKNYKKHGWDKFEEGFIKVFRDNGFIIITDEKKSDTSKNNKSYKIVVDYDYGYLIYAYKMQYSNLKADIIDLTSSEKVGNIIFSDRFNIKETAEVICKELQSKPLPNGDGQTSQKTTKSKEERLLELKNLFEKGLITQEEYDTQKKKILDEQ